MNLFSLILFFSLMIQTQAHCFDGFFSHDDVSCGSLQATKNVTLIQTSRSILAKCGVQVPELVEIFDRMTREWESYHEKKPAFDINSLIRAAHFAITHYADQLVKEGKSSLSHVMRLVNILWTEGHVRSVNVLIATFMDHIHETGVIEEQIKLLFGDRVVATLNDDHGPTKSEQEHRQAHLDLAPRQSIDAQIIHVAHIIDTIRHRAPFVGWKDQDIVDYLTWNQNLLNALHGAHACLEDVAQKEILAQQKRFN